VERQLPPLPPVPRVLVLMETSYEFGREAIRGIGDYARTHGPWILDIQRTDQRPMVFSASRWRCQGVIGRIPSQRIWRAIKSRKLPVVCLASAVHGVPEQVGTRQETLCQLALTHLLDRGFRNLAFYGRHTSHGRSRFRIFEALALKERCTCISPANKKPFTSLQLTQWVRGLARPTAILCSDDHNAREVLDALRNASIAVPEEIAVLGFDNDALMCDIAHPRLSSIVLNPQRIGYEAAAMLDALMHGKPVPQRVEVPPLGVKLRRSTDNIACDDPAVARAVRFIHEKAITGVGVGDVARHAFTSRRALEIRFRKAMGKSVHQAIHDVQLQHAKEMLIHNDCKLAVIAEKSGFSSTEYMHRIFRRELKCTPNQFRMLNGRHAPHPVASGAEIARS
jgi:LacI family transcriptional regulator